MENDTKKVILSNSVEITISLVNCLEPDEYIVIKLEDKEIRLMPNGDTVVKA